MSADIGYGYVRCRVGEIITADTEYWARGEGPWTRYGGSPCSLTRGEIGNEVQARQFPTRRPETTDEWLARGGDPTLPDPPPGWVWLINEGVPYNAPFWCNVHNNPPVWADISANHPHDRAMGFSHYQADRPSFRHTRFLVPRGLPLLPYSVLGASGRDRDRDMLIWLASLPNGAGETLLAARFGDTTARPSLPRRMVSNRPPPRVRRASVVPLNLP